MITLQIKMIEEMNESAYLKQVDGSWILSLLMPLFTFFHPTDFQLSHIKLLVWFRWFIVFNATFNHVSVISWRSVLLVEEITDMSQVTDKLYHIKLYRVHLTKNRVRTYQAFDFAIHVGYMRW